MKILFVSHEEKLNGATLSLLGMIDELKKNKHKIFVLTCYKEGPFIDELNTRNIKIIYAPYRRWLIYKPQKKIKWIFKKYICLCLCSINYLSAFKVKKIINNEKIDIIHSNTSVVNIGAILSKICNIDHIWHIREFGEEDFNIHNIYSEKIMFNYFNRSKYVIAVSNAIKDKYKGKIDENKIKVIYNGISNRNKVIRSFEKKKNNINLIIAGAITEGKGQIDAVLAINELKNRGYNNIKLSIAGSGDTNILKYKIDELGLNNNINMLGQVRNLPEIRKNNDIELVCSKSEAFGRVTIEAMMSMMPVIGANTGGTKELIKDKYNGLLYEQGNYKSLANKIEYFIVNRDEIERMAKNAYVFSKGFTVEKNMKQIYELYKQ